MSKSPTKRAPSEESPDPEADGNDSHDLVAEAEMEQNEPAPEYFEDQEQDEVVGEPAGGSDEGEVEEPSRVASDENELNEQPQQDVYEGPETPGESVSRGEISSNDGLPLPEAVEEDSSPAAVSNIEVRGEFDGIEYEGEGEGEGEYAGEDGRFPVPHGSFNSLLSHASEEYFGEGESEEEGEDEERIPEIPEAKDEALREKLHTIRAKVRQLIERNLELPPPIRLTNEDLVIDPRPSAAQRAFIEQKLIDYYRAQEFKAAKQFVQMQKIHDFFFNIEAHYVVVKDLEHTNQVSTFRLRVPSAQFWKVVEHNQKSIEEESSVKAEAFEECVHEVIEPVKRFYAKDMIGEFEDRNYDIGTMHAIKHLEKRLEKRYYRECEWRKLDAEKIPEDWVAAEDVAALKQAEETIGDFKLKLDKKYKGENVTTAQRRQRILDLKLRMYEKMHQFNKLVYLLKDEKPGLIEECRALTLKLKTLQKYLPAKMRKPIPVIHDLKPSENPEKLFEIFTEDVERKIEEKVAELGFQEQKEAMEKKLYGDTLQSKLPHEDGPILHEIPDIYKRKPYSMKIGAILDNAPRPTQEVLKGLARRLFTPKIQPLPPKPVDSPKLNHDGMHASVFRYRHLFYSAKHEPDTVKRDTLIAQKKFHQQQLYDKLSQKINYFKSRMLAVIGEKVHLETNLKLMQITMLTFLEELDISKHFDEEEQSIDKKLKSVQEDISSIKEKSLKAKKKMDRANESLEAIQRNMNQTHKEVGAIIGENHRFVDYLWKLFKSGMEPTLLLGDSKSFIHSQAGSTTSVRSVTSVKSIQANEKNEASGEGEGKVEASASEAQSQQVPRISGSITSSFSHARKSRPSRHSRPYNSMVQAPSIKYDFVHCPEGLQKVKFDKVREFRTKQRRLRVELESRRRISDHATGQFEEIESKMALKQDRLADLEEKIRTLQQRKQERINNIDQIVLVKAHQIQCLDDEKVETIEGDLEQKLLYAFDDPKDILAISTGVTDLLDGRSEELKAETKVEQDKLRRASNLLRRVKEELVKKEKVISELEKTCNEDMMKKFGRIVDLDQISAAVINLGLLDTLSRLERRRNEQFFEHFGFKKEIEETKEKLMGVTKINSELNTLVAILEERQRDVEYYMHLQGKGDDVDKPMELRDQPSYEISESREFRSKNDDMEDEIDRLDEILWYQEMKIGVLRAVITMCKTKNGVPPLIPLKTIPRAQDVGRMFVTYQEMEQFRESKDKNVRTLHKKDDIMESLERSNSQVPFHQHHHRHSHGRGHQGKGDGQYDGEEYGEGYEEEEELEKSPSFMQQAAHTQESPNEELATSQNEGETEQEQRDADTEQMQEYISGEEEEYGNSNEQPILEPEDAEEALTEQEEASEGIAEDADEIEGEEYEGL